jgi:pyrophosphatase PpaX
LARRGLELCGLSGPFSAFVGLEDTERHKPDPMPLLVGAARLAVLPGRALYVGDAPADAAAASAAGMSFAAALWGGLDLLASLDGAVARLQNPADLLALLP